MIVSLYSLRGYAKASGIESIAVLKGCTVLVSVVFLPHMIDFGMSTPLTTVIVAGMFLLLMMRSASEIFSVQFSLYS